MKRKILAAVLASLMVVALVPTTLISAAVSALWASNAEVAASSGTALRVTASDGSVIGTYDSFLEADAALVDGATITLLRDIELTKGYAFGTGRPKFVEKPYGTYTVKDAENQAGEALRYNEFPEHLPITYTVDGNGYRIIFEPTDAGDHYAISFNSHSHADIVTLRGLTVVSARGCVDLNVGSSGQMLLTLENCRLYASNMYWMRDRAFYNYERPTFGDYDCLSQGYVGVEAMITGEDTEFFAYTGAAVWSNGIVSIYDGLFYTANSSNTICQSSPNQNDTNANRHTFIYGGTFVAEQGVAVRASNGARAFIVTRKPRVRRVVLKELYR